VKSPNRFKWCVLLGAFSLLAQAETPPAFKGIAQARVEKGYAAVVFADGHKGMFPFSGLTDADREWLQQFAAEHPLGHSKSTVTVSRVEALKTIERATHEGTTETVQLSNPGLLRDQIGGTCALYARVHLMAIAGYPLNDGDIYKVIATSPPENPWADPGYAVRLDQLGARISPAPVAHVPDAAARAFDWVRQQLRLGRPVLAGLRREMWLTLPAEFIAVRGWDGNGNVGHAVVVNGFTYDPTDPTKDTFHVINSWKELPEFDMKADRVSEGSFTVLYSLSPRGEVISKEAKDSSDNVTVISITREKPSGKQFLFVAETNVGTRRVVAADEASARGLIEGRDAPSNQTRAVQLSSPDHDGENLIMLYDSIMANWPADQRDQIASRAVTMNTKTPSSTKFPYLEATVDRGDYCIYFVRVTADHVLKIQATSPVEAVEMAR
jgi:hypothetical protein